MSMHVTGRTDLHQSLVMLLSCHSHHCSSYIHFTVSDVCINLGIMYSTCVTQSLNLNGVCVNPKSQEHEPVNPDPLHLWLLQAITTQLSTSSADRKHYVHVWRG